MITRTGSANVRTYIWPRMGFPQEAANVQQKSEKGSRYLESSSTIEFCMCILMSGENLGVECIGDSCSLVTGGEKVPRFYCFWG